MRGTRVINTSVSLALLLSLVGLIWFSLGAPLQEWRRQALEGQPKLIDQVHMLQDRLKQLKEEREVYSNTQEMDVLWRATQTGEVTARIQSELSQIASQQGINLRSIGPSRTRDLDLAQAVGFILELEAPLDRLSAFLRDIEYHSPALLVEKASLRRVTKPNSTQPQPLVFVQIEVLAPIVLTEGPSR